MLGTAASDTNSIIRLTVMQGQARVSADPRVELTTVLGSCVATCLFDAEAGVGGMNHFLLAEPPASHDRRKVDIHYGVYLMELLINEMMAFGASKARMRAHLYGGANLRVGMAPIGTANARFAKGFLAREGIPLIHGDLGGNQARRVDFRPAVGKARCRSVEGVDLREQTPVRPVANVGDVELF
ncbi:MAG: chemotaxis protein CheD [Novosphingobium sp.]